MIIVLEKTKTANRSEAPNITQRSKTRNGRGIGMDPKKEEGDDIMLVEGTYGVK